VFVQSLISGQLFGRNICEDFETSDELIPQHLLYDENGDPFFRDEVGVHTRNANCHMINGLNQVSREYELEADEIIEIIIGTINGERFEFDNGVVFDGTKQAMRVSLLGLFTIFAYIELDLLEPIRPIGLFGEDPCETFINYIKDAQSLELSFYSLLIVVNEHLFSRESDRQNHCTPNLIIRPIDELIERAKLGETEAAIALAIAWIDEVGDTLFIDALDRNRQLEKFRILVLENTIKYPLLTTTAIWPLFSLYVFDFDDIPRRERIIQLPRSSEIDDLMKILRIYE